MVRRLKEIRNFQFKGILVILGCFLMMAVILFAERAGIHYQEKKRQISYIDRDRIVTEKEVVSSLVTTHIDHFIDRVESDCRKKE